MVWGYIDDLAADIREQSGKKGPAFYLDQITWACPCGLLILQKISEEYGKILSLAILQVSHLAADQLVLLLLKLAY